jgi:hypothetical protein
VNHLQGDAECQLHQDVEDDVEVATVHQHVGEEPPNLILLVGVEDQGAVEVRGSVWVKRYKAFYGRNLQCS